MNKRLDDKYQSIDAESDEEKKTEESVAKTNGKVVGAPLDRKIINKTIQEDTTTSCIQNEQRVDF